MYDKPFVNNAHRLGEEGRDTYISGINTTQAENCCLQLLCEATDPIQNGSRQENKTYTYVSAHGAFKSYLL